MMRGIKDLEEKENPCNCKHMSLKADVTYLCGGTHRKGTVVYEVHNKTTGMADIGKTQ